MEIRTKAEHVISLDNDEMVSLSRVLDFLTKCEDEGLLNRYEDRPTTEEWITAHDFTRKIRGAVLL